MISLLLLLNHFYPAISHRRVQKESDEFLCTVLVTRYGPRSVASATWLKVDTSFVKFVKCSFQIGISEVHLTLCFEGLLIRSRKNRLAVL